MESSAKLRYARLSPQKTRLVVDMVRGKKVQDALNILKFSLWDWACRLRYAKRVIARSKTTYLTIFKLFIFIPPY